jgi:hypothetical protein
MLLRFSLIVNCREYPPEIVPVMMFASRTAGLMAHFREAMSKSDLTVSEIAETDSSQHAETRFGDLSRSTWEIIIRRRPPNLACRRASQAAMAGMWI